MNVNGLLDGAQHVDKQNQVVAPLAGQQPAYPLSPPLTADGVHVHSEQVSETEPSVSRAQQHPPSPPLTHEAATSDPASDPVQPPAVSDETAQTESQPQPQPQSPPQPHMAAPPDTHTAALHMQPEPHPEPEVSPTPAVHEPVADTSAPQQQQPSLPEPFQNGTLSETVQSQSEQPNQPSIELTASQKRSAEPEEDEQGPNKRIKSNTPEPDTQSMPLDQPDESQLPTEPPSTSNQHQEPAAANHEHDQAATEVITDHAPPNTVPNFMSAPDGIQDAPQHLESSQSPGSTVMGPPSSVPPHSSLVPPPTHEPLPSVEESPFAQAAAALQRGEVLDFAPKPDVSWSKAEHPLSGTPFKFAQKIMKDCLKSKAAPPLSVPVDPYAFNLPTYWSVIKHPMDLGTVSQKLNGGAYASLKDFAQDMRLVFLNCYRFNGEGAPVSTMAKQIESLFESKINRPPTISTSQKSSQPRKNSVVGFPSISDTYSH